MRIGLALSGGGFRATLYHLGIVRYLRDADLLRSVSHITSVSGGSVLAGHLVLNWDRYCGDSNDFDSAAREVLEFVRLDVRNRIMRRYPFMLATGIARRATRLGPQRPMTRTMLLEQHYQRHLFGDTCLYQLPNTPELHILCTNLSHGGLSSFTRNGLLIEHRSKSGKSTMHRQRVGLATVPMAVASSSAFPGFFPPMELTAQTVGAVSGEFETQYFTDGGVYDNLGIRMFHHISKHLQGTLGKADFVDVDKAMYAWNQAAHQQETTPLRRLVELYASSPVAANASGTGVLQEPQEFTQGLYSLLSTVDLHCDDQLLTMLRDTSAGDEPDASQGKGASNGGPNGASNGASNEEFRTGTPSREERLALNRQLLQRAFVQTTGQALLRPRNQPFDAILASDAGKKIQVTGGERAGGILRTALRSSDILMDRVWQLEQDHFKNAKGFIFLPITRVVSQADDATAPHPEVQVQISHIRTDMDRFSDREISGLVRHGYCVARNALAAHPALFESHQVDLPPWDPTGHSSTTQPQATHTAARPGAPPAATTVEARKLQGSTYRRYWNLLTAPSDWATYLYIPILLLLFILPWMGWRLYRHVHINSMLSGAITQSRQDYGHLLSLLEDGPVQPWKPLEFVEADAPSALFAEQGLDMICDARITDLRNWHPSGATSGWVYVCRHVSLRKTDQASRPTALRMQSLWDSADVLIRCDSPEFSPVLRRCNLGKDGAEGPYLWEVQLDFSSIAIGETANLVVEAIVRQDSIGPEFEKREWWRYEVDGDPELAAGWILLPEDNRYSDFNVVKYDYTKNERVAIVQPTRQSVIRHGTVLNWAVVHPDAGVTYSCRWKRQL